MRYKMRRKLVVYNSESLTVGVRIDGKKIRCGGGNRCDALLAGMLEAADMHLDWEALRYCARRWVYDLEFPSVKSAEAVVERWRNAYVTKEVRCFRRLMH